MLLDLSPVVVVEYFSVGSVVKLEIFKILEFSNNFLLRASGIIKKKIHKSTYKLSGANFPERERCTEAWELYRYKTVYDNWV